MKYIYKTATKNVVIELDESWYDILKTEDHDEFNQERRHTRADHKYAGGTPIMLGDEESADDWLVFCDDTSFRAVELKVDLEMALKTLTDLQRRYFVLNRIWGYSNSEIARSEKKDESAIRRSVRGAEKKIRVFLK